eukprot:TRINITY_DN9881_c0_g3_i1.p1 TRINITY_DN9881_c0_g3~~TRINITY_DN9881_c0_g3_i1.p1  ORF type:complete len:581 (+),score=195.96 TRINITY_DN9881_c0_g3_i1:49-1791(+)
MAEPTSIERGHGLADDMPDEDADAWVRRMRKRKRTAAAAAAQAFDDLDEAAEVADHVPAGLKVQHRVNAFEKGSEVILNLKDESIFDDSGKELRANPSDVLESSALVGDEKRAFQKAARVGHYNKYDEDQQGILPQYDDSNREFESARHGFKLDASGELDSVKAMQEDEEAAAAAAAAAGKTRYNLQGGEFTLQEQQRDTYTAEEEAKFRPRKRRRVARKKDVGQLVREAAEELREDPAERPARSAEPDMDVEQADALRKLAEREHAETVGREQRSAADREIAGIAQRTLTLLKEAPVGAEDGWQLRDDSSAIGSAVGSTLGRSRKRSRTEAGKIVLDPTAEFARTIDTEHAMAERARQEEQEHEERREEAARRAAQQRPTSTMQVELDKEQLTREQELRRRAEEGKRFRDRLKEEELIPEPKVSSSVAAARDFLNAKGLYDVARIGRSNDRVLEFDPTSDPAPNIVFERKDDRGRDMTLKEAFRFQSHIFHGKMPSRKKREKSDRRWSGLRREALMRDGDTGLRGIAGLRAAQESTGSAGILLQGGLAEKAARLAREGLETPAYSQLGSTVSSAAPTPR